ncbi:MAG: MBL fold metallo-hydrolase, partial [Oscillospiraceae bacterium]|nr:MBL fold metallo-hydrolase [Oscillospiraceae bacterium]
MTIHAIQYARSTLPESMVLTGGDPKRKCDIVFLLYVIDTEGKCVLVDAGCDTMPGFQMEDFVSPAKALKDYGIEPDWITDVIVTHAHHDHIDGLRHFPGANVYIQAEEYSKGRKYIPETARVYIFEEECVVADRIRVKRVGGHSMGSSIALVQVADAQYVFGGDECYLTVCLEKGIPTGASCDPKMSRWFVTHFSAPGYRVLLSHDPKMKTGMIISE